MALVTKRLELGALAFWAVLVGVSAAHNLSVLDDQAREVALARSRMLFSMIETTRLWNALRGGVYAPADENTPPNPYLPEADRDVDIHGQAYTKVNPAYMTRQIADLVKTQKGTVFHITSLRPIRPENGPDAWEAAALKRFERGEEEVLDVVPEGDRPTYRYMARLLVRPECMPCHHQQGYKVGDVRGGISVTLPAGEVTGEMTSQRNYALSLHLAGFLLLSGASLAFIRRLRASWRDLAEAKAAEERRVAERTAELRDANEELARSNAELENFAYIASHDLQEPLRMMGSYAQLIRRRYGERLDGDGQEFLGYMSDGAARMKAMIDDLLAYSRVGRQAAEPRPVALDPLLDAVLADLSAAMRDADAEVIRPAALPTVMGEPLLLQRLLQNLLGNAVKYHRPGVAPRITVSARPAEAGWEISVADNGIGIPKEARERVFLIFQRLHTREAYPGTGIGLAICRKIVERHGGRIWIEDGEGEGTVFCFTLPADVSTAEQVGRLQLEA